VLVYAVALRAVDFEPVKAWPASPHLNPTGPSQHLEAAEIFLASEKMARVSLWDLTDDDFRRCFGVPETHRLERTSARSGMDIQRWEHEEFSPRGELVSRYSSWFGIDGSGAASKYTKYDLDGTPLATGSLDGLLDANE
jgi:hypothetical protein